MMNQRNFSNPARTAGAAPGPIGRLRCRPVKKSKYSCDEPNPQSLCNAGNTCGSANAPCDVDVKRTAYAASATPQIPGAKGNSLFCLRPGTTVNWKSSAKNTGFVVDVSDASPFDPGGAIIGGSNKDAFGRRENQRLLQIFGGRLRFRRNQWHVRERKRGAGRHQVGPHFYIGNIPSADGGRSEATFQTKIAMRQTCRMAISFSSETTSLPCAGW